MYSADYAKGPPDGEEVGASFLGGIFGELFRNACTGKICYKSLHLYDLAFTGNIYIIAY